MFVIILHVSTTEMRDCMARVDDPKKWFPSCH